jgi:hypothetical protein
MLTVAPVVLTACSTSPSQEVVSQQEDFSSSNTYAHGLPGSVQLACEAARRALLSQGYVINDAKAASITGRKNFQPQNDVHMQIEFHVVCAPNSKGSHSTTIFANAVRDRYSLKKNSTSASVGVPALASLSLPFGSSDDSMVKVASETIASKKFYSRFFELVENYLDATGSDSEETKGKEALSSDAGDE